MRIRYMILAGMLAVTAIAFIAWLISVCLAIRRGQPSTCPRCDSHRIRPSWPTLLDRVLPPFVCAYRCEFCQKRYFALRASWVRPVA